jgi:peptide/nickel transport system permease protein
MTALLVDTSNAPPVETVARRGGGLWGAIRRSRKGQVGLVMLFVFCVFAAVPQLFTSVRHPNDLAFAPRLPPSGAHWLGTTALGQDIWCTARANRWSSPWWQEHSRRCYRW